MKKVLAMLLAIIFVFSVMTVGTTATDVNKGEIFDYAFQLFQRGELFDRPGNVTEGGTFPADVISVYTTTMICLEIENTPWSDYEVKNPDYPDDYIIDHYVVPEDVFIDAVSKYFNITDDVIAELKEQIIYSEMYGTMTCYDAENKTYRVQRSQGGGATNSIYRGYINTSEENVYEVYSILVDYLVSCTPDETMVEWTDYYNEYGECYEVYKIIKSKVELTGTDLKLLTYEEITEMPTNIITEESPSLSLDNGTFSVEIPKGTVPTGAKIEADEIKDGEAHNTIKDALDGIASKFMAYDVYLSLNGTKIQPDGAVTISFKIPNDWDMDKVAIYYVSDDGETVEKMNCTINQETRYCLTYDVTHFSNYVLVETADQSTTGAGEGEATTLPTVPSDQQNTSPKTSDDGTLPIAVVLATLSAVAFLMIKRIKV